MSSNNTEGSHKSEGSHIYLDEAREELKRADHLIYVSLKYTRTGDVFRSIFERLINCLEFATSATLEYAKNEKVLDEVPSNMGLKLSLLKKTYPGELTNDIVNFLNFLKSVCKAEYKLSNEFRRHVTMTVMINDNVLNIDMDKIKEYFEKTKVWVMQLEALISNEEYIPEM